jgi:hypothetical protein
MLPMFQQQVQTNYRRSRTRQVEVEQTDLFELLEDPSLSQGYRHLTLTLLANGPDCKQVRNGMDGYVAAEIKGQVVHRDFPELWLHIQACQHCREFHDLIHFITRETSPLDDGWESVQVTAQAV